MMRRTQPARVSPDPGLGGVGSLAGTGTAPASAMAGPFQAEDFARLVPPDKKLDPKWIKSLYARGESTVYRGEALELIGMFRRPRVTDVGRPPLSHLMEPDRAIRPSGGRLFGVQGHTRRALGETQRGVAFRQSGDYPE